MEENFSGKIENILSWVTAVHSKRRNLSEKVKQSFFFAKEKHSQN